jgi:hypothetical protein
MPSQVKSNEFNIFAKLEIYVKIFDIHHVLNKYLKTILRGYSGKQQ